MRLHKTGVTRTGVMIPLLCFALAGCAVGNTQQADNASQTRTDIPVTEENTVEAESTETVTSQTASSNEYTTETISPDADETETQGQNDAGEAVREILEDGTDLTVNAAGTYVFQGTANNATIIVDAGDTDSVEIVLDGVTVTNDDFPCIYVKNADRVLVSSTDSDNALSVTGAFRADGTTGTDAVIFSKDDLELAGEGTIRIASRANGITGKDDLKITGGTLTVDCVADAIEANNSIEVTGGSITIASEKDGLHAEYDKDDTLGSILITGGSLVVDAVDDAVHGTTTVRIDGGDLKLTGTEAIEATVVEINGGTIEIAASDDGINASQKSTFATPVVTINDGSLTIVIGEGDTDAIDSNGSLYINGGTIDITAQSPFDYDGEGQLNGGSLIVNGTQVETLTNRMAGGGRGGFGGGFPGGNNPVQWPGEGTSGERPEGFPGEGFSGGMPDAGTFPGGGRGGFPGDGRHGHGRGGTAPGAGGLTDPGTEETPDAGTDGTPDAGTQGTSGAGVEGSTEDAL